MVEAAEVHEFVTFSVATQVKKLVIGEFVKVPC